MLEVKNITKEFEKKVSQKETIKFLADNDISIDNIKLALSDLKFSDELDAATLYSCIIDDKSFIFIDEFQNYSAFELKCLDEAFLDPVSSVAPTAYIVWQNIVNSYQLWRKDVQR